MSLTEITYPVLQTLLELTARRDYLREKRRQQHWRTRDVAALLQFSREQALMYANRMAERSAGFRRHLQEAGVPLPIAPDEDSWRRLPIVTKNEIRRDLPAWYTVPVNSPDLYWTTTSGSSGEPFRCPISSRSLHAETACANLNRRNLGCRPGWKEATIKAEVRPLSGFRRFARALMGNTPLTFASLKISPANAPQLVETLRRERVKFLRGYPSALLLLAEVMLKENLRCPIPVLMAFGEQLTAAGAEIIERAFEGKVFRNYGLSEAQEVGMECRFQNGYHLDLTRYHVEIVDGGGPVKAGEMGQILVTAFCNDAAPLVRYGTGDLGIPMDPFEACPCGNPFPRLSEVLGRLSRVVSDRGGPHYDDFYFFHFLGVIESAKDHIVRYRVIQQSDKTYEVWWVPRHERASEHLPAIETRIRQAVRTPITLSWREVADIPPDPSGKRTPFVPLK